MRSLPTLDYYEANHLLESIVAEATMQQYKVAIAVVDARGNLQAFAALDGSSQLSGVAAIAKAKTAIDRGDDTVTIGHRLDGETGKWVPDQSAWSATDLRGAHALDPNFCPWAGGVLVSSPDGESILGAIGVSGLDELADHFLASCWPAFWIF